MIKMYRIIIVFMVVTSLFLINTRQVVARGTVVGETRFGIKFEVDTTGGGVPTTPPVVPENPSNNELDLAQGQGNLPTTGEQRTNGLVMLGLLLMLVNLILFMKMKERQPYNEN